LPFYTDCIIIVMQGAKMKYWKIFLIIVAMLMFHTSIFCEEEQEQPSDEFIKYKELAEKGDANAQFESIR